MLRFGPTSRRASHILSELWEVDPPKNVRVAAAFATEAGARTLRDLVPAAEFDSAEKRWLIGIEKGITQPEALAYLSGLPDSEVRVPFGLETLQSPALRASTFFHPKLYVFTCDRRLTIVSSSANLTESGLRDNIEQFLAWSGARTEPTSATVDAWWTRMWSAADVADPTFIEDYTRRRPTVQPPVDQSGPRGPILEAEPAPADLKGADWMWVEALRPLEGGSNNQFELFLSGYHFFYPDAEPLRGDRRQLEFVGADGRIYDNPERVIHFNGPPFMARGNSMWRVRLPTAAEGLIGYQDGGVILRFVRMPTLNRYLLEIADVGSELAHRWERESRKLASVPGPPTRRMGWA